ncbi:hypothetical protein, partial [Staphylococcus saprophyticus]|uniref:hypothetical protein n=1 Tax=Staphylococcus saprophyticus TaxID=29385 RepID=UPI0011A1FAE2
MGDLNIGGGGNLLGKEEEGLIDCVGLDLYCEMLEEGVNEKGGVKGEKEDAAEIEIEVNMDGYLGGEYIGNEECKIEMYKKLGKIES